MAKKTHNSRTEMASQRRYARGGNISIGDRNGLASLLEELIDVRFGGSVARAARETRVPRALLRRLLAGSQRSIRSENVDTLRRLFGNRYADVERALIVGVAKNRLHAYDGWLHAAREVADFGFDGPPKGTPHTLRKSEIGRLTERRQLLRRLQRLFPREWDPLYRVVTRRHYRARAELAFARVIAPLLDSFDTQGIERSASEFTEAELRAFVKAGVTRERLLLKRENDLERAQSAAIPQLRRVTPTYSKRAPSYDWMMDLDTVTEPQRG